MTKMLLRPCILFVYYSFIQNYWSNIEGTRVNYKPSKNRLYSNIAYFYKDLFYIIGTCQRWNFETCYLHFLLNSLKLTESIDFK